MLDNIKSKFILKKVFSFMMKKRLLHLINYNKKLQTELKISLIDYCIMSGKCVIYEGSMQGKIYDVTSNELIYEGGLLNGKKNGKGKEYDKDGKLEYEGEYLNGEKNGKVKIYYNNGKLEYEGEYLNGEKNGKGKVIKII